MTDKLECCTEFTKQRLVVSVQAGMLSLLILRFIRILSDPRAVPLIYAALKVSV